MQIFKNTFCIVLFFLTSSYAFFQRPVLTDEEAYNVAAFINMDSNFRPDKADRIKDFPLEDVKAPDVYRPNIETKENQVGPFGKFIK